MEHHVPAILTTVHQILTTSVASNSTKWDRVDEAAPRQVPNEQLLWAAVVEEANNLAMHRRISRLLDAIRECPGDEHQVIGERTLRDWVRLIASHLEERDPLERGPAALIERLLGVRAR